MAEFPAIPLWTDALLADTGHLDDAEIGRYFRLLIVMWRSPECRIPNDVAWISKRMRVQPLEYARLIAPLIDEFCITDGNYLSQKRLMKEFHFVRKMSKDQSARALKRWSKVREENDEKNPKKTSVSDNPMKELDLGLCPSDAPTPTPTPTPREKENPIVPSEGFEDFWSQYPKQRAGSKEKARTAYLKALTRTTKEEIHHGTVAYAQSAEVARGYAKGAAAWLNDDRWTVAYGQNRQHHNPQASGMGKIALIAEGARALMQARMDADRGQPWDVEQPSEARGRIGHVPRERSPEPPSAGAETWDDEP